MLQMPIVHHMSYMRLRGRKAHCNVPVPKYLLNGASSQQLNILLPSWSDISTKSTGANSGLAPRVRAQHRLTHGIVGRSNKHAEVSWGNAHHCTSREHGILATLAGTVLHPGLLELLLETCSITVRSFIVALSALQCVGPGIIRGSRLAKTPG